jgi:hypothetical protein
MRLKARLMIVRKTTNMTTLVEHVALAIEESIFAQIRVYEASCAMKCTPLLACNLLPHVIAHNAINAMREWQERENN